MNCLANDPTKAKEGSQKLAIALLKKHGNGVAPDFMKKEIESIDTALTNEQLELKHVLLALDHIGRHMNRKAGDGTTQLTTAINELIGNIIDSGVTGARAVEPPGAGTKAPAETVEVEVEDEEEQEGQEGQEGQPPSAPMTARYIQKRKGARTKKSNP